MTDEEAIAWLQRDISDDELVALAKHIYGERLWSVSFGEREVTLLDRDENELLFLEHWRPRKRLHAYLVYELVMISED